MVQKEYYAQVDGLVTPAAVLQLLAGVTVSILGEAFSCQACHASIIDEPPWLPDRSRAIRDQRHGATSWLSLTIDQGKYRQVRKMTFAVLIICLWSVL